MCLPIKILKGFAFFQVFLEVILSIVAFIGAYYVSKLLNQVDDNLRELGIFFIKTSYFSKYFWVLAFGILIVGICGILGTLIKEKKFFLVIFNVGNLCLSLSFAILAIIALILYNSIEKDHVCLPTDAQYTMVQQMYIEAERYLCKDECECYYYKEITPEVSKEVKVYSKTDKTKSIKVQECKGFDKNAIMSASAIEWMEEKFDCSGWCIQYPIKMFDDINSDVKDYNHTCYAAIGNYFKQIFYVTKILFCVLASIMAVMVVLTCCLGYHPDHQHKFKNYRQIQDQKQ